MFTLLCLAALGAYALTAPTDGSHHSVVIDYKKGLFFEDLARRYMVLVMNDACYFWHMTQAEAATGLSPSGIRHIENEFIADLEKGVNLTRLYRSNFNHMAGSIIFNCRDVSAYWVEREHLGSLTDLYSVGLQGTLSPNVTVTHGSSKHN